jgi:protein-tyrosine phosphatase
LTTIYNDYLTEGPWLAQGSAPPVGSYLPFDVIVLSAREYQPNLLGYIVMHVPLSDRPNEPPPDPPTRTRIRRAAHAIVSHMRNQRRVLVTCWEGRNRSGVLAGLAMRELGVPGIEAAQLIRRLRDGLTNPHFYKMVARP